MRMLIISKFPKNLAGCTKYPCRPYAACVFETLVIVPDDVLASQGRKVLFLIDKILVV